MKKVFLFVSTLCTLVFFVACSEQPKANTHQHEDGSTHSDHAADTAKVQQQEFTVGDSTQMDTTTTKLHTKSENKEHAHGDGEKHSH
jgi:hypothetical protein